MKKWMYLIFPGIMLAIFLMVFLSHSKEAEAREATRLKVVADKMTADAAKKKADEDRARADAQKRADERAPEEAKKEADKIAKQAAIDKDIKDATDKANAEAASSQKTIDAHEAELEALHKHKNQLTSENFESAKQVELAKVAKR